MRACLLIAALIACTPVAAAASRIELSFEIIYGNMKLGEGRDVLQYDSTRYSVSSLSEPQGLADLFINDIRRESRGWVTASGLKPERFEESGRKDGSRVATFNWEAGTISLAAGGNTETAPLPPNTVDQACLPYGFVFIAPAEGNFLVHVTDGRRVSQYQYRLLAREKIQTRMGELDTLHYEKVREPDDKRSFEFWLAVDHKNLPVKLRYSDKKNRVFQSIVTSIKLQ